MSSKEPIIIIDENFLNEEEIAYMQKAITFGEVFTTRWVFDSDSELNIPDDDPAVIRNDLFEGSPQICMVGQHDHTDIENAPFNDYAKSLLSKFAIKHQIPVQQVLRTKSTGTFPKPDPRPDWPHVDYVTPGYVLLIYVNDSEGDTIMYNETYTGEKPAQLTERVRVTPKAGKAVLFNNYIYHAVACPVNNKFRQVINMNFTALPFEDNR
jgi:hypothetical protein